MADRNAAKVLPDPVGAATRTCSPAASAGHARTCASVGASKVRENHAATAGWNELSTLMNFSRRGPLIVSGRDAVPPQGGLGFHGTCGTWRDRSDRCPAAVFRKAFPQNKIRRERSGGANRLINRSY